MLIRLLTLALLIPPSVADDPPPPNPKQPVNYIKWINDAYGKNVKENAADKYRAAIDAYVENKDARAIFSAPKESEWTKSDLETIRAWIAANESCLATFVEASAIRRCFFELDIAAGSLMEVEMPWLASIRAIAHVLAARARLRLNEGDVLAAVDDCIALRRTAHHLSLQPNIIDYLVGTAIASMSYRILSEIPRRSDDKVDYDAILTKVKRYDRPIGLRPIRQLDTEKLSHWDILQRLARDKDGDGLLDNLSGMELMEGPITPISIETALKDADEAYDRCKKVFTRDYKDARERTATFERDLASRKPSLVRIMVGSGLMRIALLQRRAVTDRNATRLVLRVHAFRSKHNRWPKNLKEATKGVPSTIRRDPFSGKDMVYRIVNGQPLLYSVGTDGDDDGGKSAADGNRWSDDDGDAVFWP